jgi:hypothetical protein
VALGRDPGGLLLLEDYMAEDTKSNVIDFPLGSSRNLDTYAHAVIDMAIREQLHDLIILGVDANGKLTVCHDIRYTPERMHYLLERAIAIVMGMKLRKFKNEPQA